MRNNIKRFLIFFVFILALSACSKDPGFSLSERNKEFSMLVGEERTIKPYVNLGFTLEWNSSDNKLLEIEVDEDSLSAHLIAKAAGVVEVKVLVKGTSVFEVINITIAKPLPITVQISGDDELEVGSSIKLVGQVLPLAADQSLLWSSEDETIATVDQNGLVTGISEGISIITAKSPLTEVFKVFVVEVIRPRAKSISISGAKTIVIDSVVKYSASISPSEAVQNSVWSVDNPLLANISQDGLLQALSAGVVIIKVAAKDNLEVFIEYEVEIVIPNPEFISLNGVSEMEIGESAFFSASITPISASQGIVWLSEDESIVIVNESGKVEALKIGSTNIIAKSLVDNSIVAKKMVSVIASIPLINFELNGGEWEVSDIDLFLKGNYKETPLGSYNPTPGAYLADYPENIFIQVSTNAYVPNLWVNRIVIIKDDNGLYKITDFYPAGQNAPESFDISKIDYLIYAHAGYKAGYEFLKLCAVGEVISIVGRDLLSLDRGIIDAKLKVYDEDSLQFSSQTKLDYDEVLPKPSKDGFTFAGWYLDSDFSGEVITYVISSLEGEVSLYAKWKVIE